MAEQGIDSEYRNNSIEENLRLMNEMCTGTPEGLLCCVRGKMGMQHKNKALRDPVFFRCKQAVHHRLGQLLAALQCFLSPTDAT